MEPKLEHACPRCYQPLRIVESRGGLRRSVLLACSEPYCDYVLVLPRRDVAREPVWRWTKTVGPARAAG
jgi:hypothetical protein